MKLDDLYDIRDTLLELGDFMSSNSDGDESGIADEMADKYNRAMEIIDAEKHKIHLRNALARLKRKRK